MDQYAPFVISAYAITAGAFAVILVWLLLDRASAKKALERAERARGRMRRGPPA
ncbi:MAG: heme exporter protein CcmD [Pseudomonadota bacterium]